MSTAAEDTPLLRVGRPFSGSKSEVYVFSRWQSFAGICLYISIVGTTYAYSIYSSLLKEKLGFSEEDLYVIASVGNTGLYMSLLGGFILEWCGLHFVVGLGACLICAGFLYIYMAITSMVSANMISISLAYLLSQFGVSCHISSAVTMTIRIFPREMRGTAVGLTKGYFALSSAVLGDLAAGYFSDAHSYFILFIALAIPAISMLLCLSRRLTFK
jgi:sugar phosphate permease